MRHCAPHERKDLGHDRVDPRRVRAALRARRLSRQRQRRGGAQRLRDVEHRVLHVTAAPRPTTTSRCCRPTEILGQQNLPAGWEPISAAFVGEANRRRAAPRRPRSGSARCRRARLRLPCRGFGTKTPPGQARSRSAAAFAASRVTPDPCSYKTERLKQPARSRELHAFSNKRASLDRVGLDTQPVVIGDAEVVAASALVAVASFLEERGGLRRIALVPLTVGVQHTQGVATPCFAMRAHGFVERRSFRESCATPAPCSYIDPRLRHDAESPAVQPRWYKAVALTMSRATPAPRAYMTPRFEQPVASPPSHPLADSDAAFAGSAATPSPFEIREPEARAARGVAARTTLLIESCGRDRSFLDLDTLFVHQREPRRTLSRRLRCTPSGDCSSAPPISRSRRGIQE